MAAPTAQVGTVQTVRVGGYLFPPFVEITADGRVEGVTLGLIAALNAHQDGYRFSFVLTAPKRRYADFRRGRYDVIFFESPDWGWRRRGLAVEPTPPFLAGGERYVALALPGRTQAFFDDLTGKHLVGALGYHYGFAGFEAEADELRRRYTITLIGDARGLLDMILGGRGDVAVITESLLKRALQRNPSWRSRLLVSDRFDQRYAHRALVRAGHRPGAAALAALLGDLERAGRLERLWRAEGLIE